MTSAPSSAAPSISPSTSPSPRSPSPPILDLPNNPATAPSTSDSKAKHTSLLIALPITAAISILLLYGVWTCMRKRKAIKTSYTSEVSEIKKAVLDSLQFDLHTIRTATNNFAIDNKLGEGGFGEVYKIMT
ncbi:hypothetical protein BVRB_8g187150 [Beta vulgaris subsp. vulgaris]|nr:hypothetical protein BVRB_8g187150 [Beta vulgaris subsp. vulgaris]